MAFIELDQVDLTFRVRQQHQITVKEYLLRGMFRQSNNPVLEVRALRDVSLHLTDGWRLGVIGANGSGKSTLLRLMAGVYHPTAGRRTVEGKVSALFDLALGFEMEANGWKNIRFRGYLQGESSHGIRDKAQGIADFSELGDFLKIPVRYYSAGMMVRLAFSAATAIEPEILLVDEVLGAGDLAFQGKAERRLNEMMEKARILVVVSHNLAVLPRLCKEGLWLEKGRIRAEGPIKDVIAAYVENTERARAVAA